MNRIYALGAQPYTDSDERIHAIEALRFKFIDAERRREKRNKVYREIGAFALIVAVMTAFIWIYATKF